MGFSGPLIAQTAPADLPQSAIVTLEQDRLFSDTIFGRALQAELEADSAALLAENRRIDAALEAEEQDLTNKRAGMDAAAFRLLADAFDKKANELRTAQGAKERDLTRRAEENRRIFFQNIAPILGDYMVERGAVAILDKAAIVVSLGSIDISDAVIVRIDKRLGDGSTVPRAPLLPGPAAPSLPAP